MSPSRGVAIFRQALRQSDVAVAFGLVFLVAMMVIPLPAAFMDILLVFNLTFSMVILLTAIYTREPLQFSIFPSLLLITTLFRVTLNVSTARLILLHAYAGEVINAFGRFVVGGDPVVGFIVFLILIVIQFIVITRGAERVAEVAARFTLDAMPGKQMSIDADLNAGLIDENQARQRRRQIEQEADFYGAMDGASKFVKGDAIAALVILAINLVGGFIMGMIRQGMDFATALQTYSLLTVGDGLVTQIPALLVSTATGFVVTRAASESNVGQDLAGQLLAQPRVLYIAAGALSVLGLVPGLAHVPLLVVAGLVAAAGYLVAESQKAEKGEAERKAKEEELERSRRPESVSAVLALDRLEVEFGYSLLRLADRAQGGDFLERVVLIRRQIATDLGFIVPPIRLRDNVLLGPTTYAILINGVEIARGEVLPDRLLAMAPPGNEEIEGIPTKEPAFGLPALWISTQDKAKAELAGYTVVEPAAVVATHLTEVLKSHADELLTRQDVQSLVDGVRERAPALVDELIPARLSLGELQKVLQNLLHERVSIRDLESIMEALADAAVTTKDTDVLTEYARQRLWRQIRHQYGFDSGTQDVVTLSPAVEQAVLDGARQGGQGQPVLEPQLWRSIQQSLRTELARLPAGATPVVVCSPLVRLYFKRLTERVAPYLVVLSFNELGPDAQIRAVGMVNVQ